MREIGGYIELGGLINKEYHTGAKFNSSRSALKYFIRSKKIFKIYLPIYLCDVVYESCIEEKCHVIFYNIDKDFKPILENIESEAYLYIVNYYGILSDEEIIKLKKKYYNIILDNTHDFFRKPLQGVCTIYNCRKYFGVPDGAYLYTDISLKNNVKEYQVIDKINHLIGRLEKNASTYYAEFCDNDNKFRNSNIFKMSKLSTILMGAIDYDTALKKRVENYNYLDKKLKKYQKLNISIKLNFMYPLYVDNGEEIRKKLISKKIYIPKLWPNIVDDNLLNDIEKKYIKNILPLPIDQRYGKKEMDYIIKVLEEENV